MKRIKSIPFVVYVTILVLSFGCFAQETTETKKTENSESISGSSIDEQELDKTTSPRHFKRFEVGVQYSFLAFSAFDPRASREWTDITPVPPGTPPARLRNNPNDSGFGARISYNFTKRIAVEAEANWYFQKNFNYELPLYNESPNRGGQKFQMLFGPKVGHRTRKFGVFGKVRPGFIHFVSYPVYIWIQDVPPGSPYLSWQTLQRSTFFNVDVGGVFEYYPSKRTIFRVDVGDTIIRYNAQEPKQYNATFTRHNLQMNVGFGFRF